MQGLHVRLLGQGRIELDGQTLTRLLAPKQQALVYFLAVAGAPVARSKLADLLWGDLDEATARANLRTALSRMRRWLPEQLQVDAQQIGLNPAIALRVDLQALTRALSPERSPAERLAAAECWRGPLLDGFEVGAAPAFDDWIAHLRPLAQRDIQALRHDLLRRSEEQGLADEALAHARALLDIDDADEAAHMALMRLLAGRGRRSAAIAQYEVCRAALIERLGARPSVPCHALYVRIHADSAAAQAASAIDAARLSARPVDPIPAIPAAQSLLAAELIGRESELALLRLRLADPTCHWLSLVGPGGVGKTGLARVAAAELARNFRHGVMWLSGRDDGGGFLHDAESLSQQVLARTGADRHAPGALLLVLDGLETVAAARSFEPLLRERAPGVKVLATSRSRVGGAQEWLLELGGLSLACGAGLAPEPLGIDMPSPAARLFASAVQRLVPDFDAVAEAIAVRQLCSAVGGLPLALQMAAHAVHTAGLAPVLQRLQHGAPLIDVDRAADDPHHSLNAVLDDSWVLLEAPSQDAALRLAQLPGEFDAELALAVGVGAAALHALRSHSWLTLSAAGMASGRLGFHPLQQDYLRRKPGASALSRVAMAGLVACLAERMPLVQPFGDLPTDDSAPDGPASRLANEACFAPPVLAAAARHCVAFAALPDLANWIDRLVAVLLRADRQGEAAQVLTQALSRADLPRWQVVAWGLRRAEMLNGDGASSAALLSYVQAFATLGLCAADIEQSPWVGLAASLQRVWRLQDWPDQEPANAAFSAIVMRSLYGAIEQFAFSPDPQPLRRLSMMTDLLARRLGRESGLHSMLTAYGAAAAGHPRLARWLCRSADRHRQRVANHDRRATTLIDEAYCVLLTGFGDWSGLTTRIESTAMAFASLRCSRHEMSMRALAAKLALFQGRLLDARRRFIELDELSLSRPGEAWRAWAPIGLVEVGLLLGTVDELQLQADYDRAASVMTAMENVDAAYTLRRLALAARLAWRRGDAVSAWAAVQTGVVAARRMQTGWWAHVGYAGLGDTLIALHRHEQRGGGVLQPFVQAWRIFEPALAQHVRRFPPAAALQCRLLGAHAFVLGRPAQAQSHLLKAVEKAEKQGMRLDLVSACQALANAEPGSDWMVRTQRLLRDMGAQSAPE
jgi:DNA-binding SARP family transcriptional activator